MISNINIGILEKKCRNKRQRSFLFDDLSELQHYQKEYGGNLNIVSEYEILGETKPKKEASLLDDGIVEDDECNEDTNNLSVHCTSKLTGKELYVLNIHNSEILNNGFRYISKN